MLCLNFGMHVEQGKAPLLTSDRLCDATLLLLLAKLLASQLSPTPRNIPCSELSLATAQNL
jgi:hypothetical protein